MNSWKIKGKSILVIPDLHQDVNWAKEVLRIEHGKHDAIIWLGDYFDSYWTDGRIEPVKQTAQFVLERMALGDKFLIGNHDLHYMEAHSYNRQYRHKKQLLHKCAGHSNNKSIDINNIFEWKDWRKLNLFYVANGWLLSHAGFNYQHLKPMMELDQIYAYHWNKSQEALELCPFHRSEYFEAGLCRGGDEDIGGPIWQDFELEFVDFPEIRQICGHTSRYNTVQQKEYSYCIDGQQTIYCIIAEDGSVQFKSIVRGFNGFESTNPKLLKYA